MDLLDLSRARGIVRAAFGVRAAARGARSHAALDEPPTLVIELQGIVADVQTAEQAAGSMPEYAAVQ
jgi:hypothetical protein